MNATTPKTCVLLRVEGTIEQLDPWTRELALFSNGTSIELLVPPDCVIRLNGERVKLRLLQQGDRAEIGYTLVRNIAFAHSINVNWQSTMTAGKRRTRVANALPPAESRSRSSENTP